MVLFVIFSTISIGISSALFLIALKKDNTNINIGTIIY